MVEERQAHGYAYSGRHFPDLPVCRLWMRIAGMGEMFWERKMKCCRKGADSENKDGSICIYGRNLSVYVYQWDSGMGLVE